LKIAPRINKRILYFLQLSTKKELTLIRPTKKCSRNSQRPIIGTIKRMGVKYVNYFFMKLKQKYKYKESRSIVGTVLGTNGLYKNIALKIF